MYNIEERRDMMSRETKVGMVGLIFFMVALIAALFLPGMKIFNRNIYEIHAVFDDAKGIRENAQVRYAGVYVGRVHKITTKDGKADLTLYMQKKAEIPEDAAFTLDSDGAIGDMYVKITGGRPGARNLHEGMVVYESQDDRMKRLMDKAQKLLDTAKNVQGNIESLGK